MAADYLATGRLPPLRIKIGLDQPCSACGRGMFMPLLPDGGQVICPGCGTRHTGRANLNEPLPLAEAAGVMGVALPSEMGALSLGQVLGMFEERLNEDYAQIFQLFQAGGAMFVQGKEEGPAAAP